MNAYLVLSMMLRVIAAIMSILIAVRMRDKRVLLLTALLLLTCIRLIMSMLDSDGVSGGYRLVWNIGMAELPGLCVSLVSIPAVYFLGQMIADTRQAYLVLQEREERLSRTVAATQVGLWEWEPMDNGVYYSPEWYRQVGLEPNEIPRTIESWDRLLHPDDRAEAWRIVEAFRQSSGGTLELSFRLRHKDGSYRWFMSRGYTAKAQDGRAILVRGVNIDITDQKRIEDALRESEQRFRGIADFGSVGIWQIDVDRRTVYANPAMCRMLGVTALSDILGVSVDLFFPEEERTRVSAELERRRDGQVSTHETEMIDRYGRRKQVIICGVPIRGSDGNYRGSIGTFTDITDLKKAERQVLESRERFAGIVESAMDGIITIDENHRIVLFNAAAELMFRCEADDVVGNPIDILIPERFRENHDGHIRSFAQTGVTSRRMGALGSIWGRRTDGDEFPIEASISQMSTGGQRYFTVILRDISERTLHEAALKESRDMLERAQSVGRIGSWWSDLGPSGELRWSKETHRIFGLSELAFDHRIESFFGLVHPQDREQVQHAVESAIQGEKPYSIEHRIVRPDGVMAWVHEEADIIRDDAGRPHMMIGVCQDITDRKRAEELESIRTFMLEQLTTGRPLSEILDGMARRMEQLRPGTHCSILLLDEDGRHIRHGAAPSLPAFYNSAIDGLEIGPDVGSCGAACFRGEPVIVADIATHPYWKEFTDLARQAGLASCWSFPVLTAGRRVAGTFAVYQGVPGEPTAFDIELITTAAHFVSVAIERVQAESARKLSEERYQALVSALTSVVWTSDSQGRFASVQRSWESYTGQSQESHLGWGWVNALHPDDRDSVTRAWQLVVQTGTPYTSEGRIWHAGSKSYHYFSARAVPLKNSDGTIREWVGTVTDVDERRRAEEAVLATKQALFEREQREKVTVEAELSKVRDELVLKTRLATIGQVSASIAHELRNPLGAVRNAAYFLKRRTDGSDVKLTQYLTIIEQEVETSDRIISNLMEMTRAKQPEKKSVNLKEVLDSILMTTAIPPSVSLEVDIRPSPFEVAADPAQLRQVMSNLVNNALHAINFDGKIRLDARRTDDYDIIIIKDSGDGVSETCREQLFEPLFTTKAKGTGLGLTICRQIIERHGGTIDYHDDGSPGAAFRVTLPRS